MDKAYSFSSESQRPQTRRNNHCRALKNIFKQDTQKNSQSQVDLACIPEEILFKINSKKNINCSDILQMTFYPQNTKESLMKMRIACQKQCEKIKPQTTHQPLSNQLLPNQLPEMNVIELKELDWEGQKQQQFWTPKEFMNGNIKFDENSYMLDY